MLEKLLSVSSLVSLLFVSISAFLYSWGGRDGTSKAWRRFLAPTLTCIGLNVAYLIQQSWNWKIAVAGILASLMLCLGYCCGYGGDTVGRRLFRRAVIAFIYILAGVSLLIIGGDWLMFLLHCINCVATIPFAFRNPLPAAREEFFIGLNSQIMLFFII